MSCRTVAILLILAQVGWICLLLFVAKNQKMDGDRSGLWSRNIVSVNTRYGASYILQCIGNGQYIE